MKKENILMQALSDEKEDLLPDDGTIEIDSDEEYQCLTSLFIDTTRMHGKNQPMPGIRTLGQGLTLNQGLGDPETSTQGLMGGHCQ
jgi:hypothetical protein